MLSQKWFQQSETLSFNITICFLQQFEEEHQAGKKISDKVLVCLSVWCIAQMICNDPADATAIIGT